SRVAWLDDGRSLLVVGSTGRIWDVAGAAVRQRLDHTGAVAGDLSPDRQRILTLGVANMTPGPTSLSDGEIRQWDARTGHAIGARFRPDCGRRPPVFAPDGRIVTTH